jgi:hypothetical protein
MTIRKASATLTCAAACLLAGSCVQYAPTAGYPPAPQPPVYPAPYAEAPAPQPTPQEAAPAGTETTDDLLVAPIALYPDPLIALILPASTVPADISAASSYMVQYGDMTQIDSQPWDPSVRGLAHYPTVLTWMAQNMPWTQALGSAFLSSPSGVMDAIQRLRSRALAAGTLASAPQQRVYSDGGVIYIYPADPGFVYVPAYDDTLVYSEGAYDLYGGPFISFGEPYPAGPWLSFYFDWGDHRVWAGDRNVWHEHGGWQPPRNGGDRSPPGAHPWHPSSAAPRTSPTVGSNRGGTPPRPRPMPGAPTPPQPQYRRPAAQPGQAAASPSYVPVPRTAAPPLDRPKLNSPTTASGAPGRPGESETLSSEQTRDVQGTPGHPPGPSSPPPPPAPPRQYSPAPARSAAPAAAPHEAAAHASSPAPAPAQGNASNVPQK